ncbi:MAG: hypothetical protein RLZZ618_3568 [Pseudomonadota bacterium]|jgi:hypothetical protein
MNKMQMLAEIAHAVAWEILYVETSISSEQVEARLKDIEERFQSKAGSANLLMLELRRAMLAHRFKVLFRRRENFNIAKSAYEEAVSFGFSEIDEEVTVHLFYAIYCFDESLLDESEGVLKNLDKILDAADGLSPVWMEQTKGSIKKLRDKFPFGHGARSGLQT